LKMCGLTWHLARLRAPRKPLTRCRSSIPLKSNMTGSKRRHGSHARRSWIMAAGKRRSQKDGNYNGLLLAAHLDAAFDAAMISAAAGPYFVFLVSSLGNGIAGLLA